ncbi:MAG: hypothetical protein HQM13_24285 [SAR324 cluster bacterium]|nr:hypothetical protein [SAR324 cluster bacterium]
MKDQSDRNFPVNQQKDILKSQYEDLRKRALSQNRAANGDMSGVALLINKGMIGWLKVAVQCEPSQSANGKKRDINFISPPDNLYPQITILLSNMILNLCK